MQISEIFDTIFAINFTEWQKNPTKINRSRKTKNTRKTGRVQREGVNGK